MLLELNLMNKLIVTALVLFMAGLYGCSTLNCGDSHPYAGSVANPALHAPPGISVPVPAPNYAIQGVVPSPDKTSSKRPATPCLIKPPQLIDAQPKVAPKPSTTPKSVPVPSAPSDNQPPLKTEDKKPAAPASPSTASPPAVAGTGGIE